MYDFEALSRAAAESGEPVEPKRDVETPEEPESVRRVRVGLDALTAELAEAKETVACLEARENELLAEKAELARSLDDLKKTVGALSQTNAKFRADADGYVDASIKKERELRRQVRDAQQLVERFKSALDSALNDVAIYRRAAFWFAASALLAVGALVAAGG